MLPLSREGNRVEPGGAGPDSISIAARLLSRSCHPGRRRVVCCRAMALRVVLAEDNLLVREGVRRLLEAEPGVEVAATCGDLDGLLEAVAAERPDVVLTDIRMPPTGTDEGLRAAAELRKSAPYVGVVVLS